MACALLAVGCSQAPPNHVVPCPTLFSGPGSAVGFLGPPGELDPFQCIELYVDGRRRAITQADHSGAFFTIFSLESQVYGRPIEMRIDGVPYTVLTGGQSRDLIDYERGTIPLQETDEGGRAHVRIRLLGTAPGRAYTVNRSNGIVEPISLPPPWSSDPVSSGTMTGVWTQLGTVLTEHLDGTGGCWWPEGTAEVIRCSDARWALDRCEFSGGGGTCVHGRGCSVIRVEERHSGIGRRQNRWVPVGQPHEPLPDAGPMMPDGGPVDAQLM